MLMLCSLAFKPLYERPSLENPQDSAKSEPISNFINLNIWKNKKYLIWVIAVPFSLCGYFVPYVHMVSILVCHFIIKADLADQSVPTCNSSFTYLFSYSKNQCSIYQMPLIAGVIVKCVF